MEVDVVDEDGADVTRQHQLRQMPGREQLRQARQRDLQGNPLADEQRWIRAGVEWGFIFAVVSATPSAIGTEVDELNSMPA